jgi:DNA (cytosine-5)-methyltransferase 1
MPAATHGPDLQSLVTVKDTLDCLPATGPDHDPDSVRFQPHKFQAPYDGNRIMPPTMMTHGGNWHPSGERGFTLREYAALQGFPGEHVFEGSYRKKQIGNAVPPCVAKVLFESIRRSWMRWMGWWGRIRRRRLL